MNICVDNITGSGDGTATGGGSRIAAGGKGGGDVQRVTPLTVEQMQQALLYLIKVRFPENKSIVTEMHTGEEFFNLFQKVILLCWSWKVK